VVVQAEEAADWVPNAVEVLHEDVQIFRAFSGAAVGNLDLHSAKLHPLSEKRLMRRATEMQTSMLRHPLASKSGGLEVHFCASTADLLDIGLQMQQRSVRMDSFRYLNKHVRARFVQVKALPKHID
jgi:hypothetical protein